MDDRRLGLVIRALRRRRGWRQLDLGSASHVSQTTISAVERGHLDSLSVRKLRQILAALEARFESEVRWRGGHLERMLDEDHARLIGRLVNALRSLGWDIEVEVTYAIYGDRGSIDVLAFHRASASLLVIEVKTELTSIEEMLRRLDEKVRLSRQIARDRFGWAAATSSQVLVIAEGAGARGGVARHQTIFDTALPARTVEVRRWLASPVGAIRGTWFIPNIDPSAGIRRSGGRDRVRKPSESPPEPEPRSAGHIAPRSSVAQAPNRRPTLAQQHGQR